MPVRGQGSGAEAELKALLKKQKEDIFLIESFRFLRLRSTSPS